MPHHPSLEEVLKERSNYEWLETKISGFFLGDFVDSENEKGEISSLSFNLFSGPSESEYGTFSFNKATIQVEAVEEIVLQNLEGKFPLGSVNFYGLDRTFITINITKKLYSSLLGLLATDLENISLKIAIPVWDRAEAKCLPVLKYKLTYKQENRI